MHYNSLFAWLKRQATQVNVSNQSSYFTIGKALIRYSDHYSRNSQCTIQIVRTDNFYIITLNEYGIPKVYTKVCDAKKFLEHYIFIYNCIHRSDIQEPIKEITQEKEIKLETTHCLTHPKNILFSAELRRQFECWEIEHPLKWSLLYDFMTKAASKNKQQRINLWLEFKKKNS